MSDPDLLAELRIDASQRPDAPGGKRWPWVVGLLLVAGIAGGLGFYTLQGRAPAVETAVAEPASDRGGDTAVLEAAGYVTARREATVSSKVTGKLAEVLIEEGEHVEKGQLIARLDGSDAEAQVKLAQAQLAAAKAQVGELEAQYHQAQRDLKRQRELHARGLAAEQQLEDARTKMFTLAAQLEAKRTSIGVARAQVHVAQVAYDDTIIRAPFAGVVVDKAAQPGEIVSPISAGGGFTRTGICTIVDMDSLEIEVDVNEAYINRVKPHQPVTAVLDAYPDWKIPAEVIAIIPTADRSKATVKVRIALKQKDPRIVPDMGVRVSFLEDQPAAREPQSGVLVPASAIVQRSGTSVVFVVRDGRVHRRVVSAGDSYGDLRRVDSGLQAGERVVRDPPAGLADGMRVKAKSAQKSTGATG